MKTKGLLSIIAICAVAGWVNTSCVTAQTSQQPSYGYDQPGYNQPNYNQPNPPGYNQPGYDQPYGQGPDFYSELSPYGQWVQTPQYGQVWIPNAGPGFQPYATNGHWVVTEYGNTWVSDYNWGWAPFHYGRWYQDPYRGWAWVPGLDWGPAWVSWRSGGGYYGWAPLGPGAGLSVNVNIPAPYWTFVPQAYITSPRVYSYYVARPRVVNIYQQTTIINNVYQVNNRSYAYGPRRDEIERVTRQSVPVYRLENANRPGRVVVQNNTVNIYRPDANRTGYNNSRNYDNSRGTGTTPTNRPRGTSVQENNPNPGSYDGRSRGGATRENAPNPGTYNGQFNASPGQDSPPAPGNYGGRSRGSGADVNQPSVQPGSVYPGRARSQPYSQPAEPVQASPQPAPVQAPAGRSFPQREQRETMPDIRRSRGNGSEQPVFQPRQNSQPVTESQPQIQQRGSSRQGSQEPAQTPPNPGPSLDRRGSRGPR